LGEAGAQERSGERNEVIFHLPELNWGLYVKGEAWFNPRTSPGGSEVRGDPSITRRKQDITAESTAQLVGAQPTPAAV
jgi:hypothetical protein